MKIPIPDNLRQRITDCLAQLDEALKADNHQRRKLAEKIAANEAEEGRVTAEIAMLKSRILHDDAMTDQIPAQQLRLDALAGELVELRRTLTGLSPVSLRPAVAVLTDVLAHWKAVFPEVFADYVSDAFITRHNATSMANLTDARRVLAPLATRCLNLREATRDNVEFITGVFKRALAGRPHLGLDTPEPKQTV